MRTRAPAFYPCMGFSNTHLSYSRVERYEQCPHAFRLHYVDKIPADPGPELRFGKAMHRVLELLLRDHVQAGQTAALSLEHAEHLWQLAWRDEGLVGVGAFYEGLRMLATFVGREGAVDPASVLGIEQPFELQVGRFRLVGAIDRVDSLGDGTIRVRDYKTNRLLFSRAEVAESLQLSIYAMAARELWPWAERIELQYDMLRHDLVLRSSRTSEELDAARRYVETIGERTERDAELAPRLSPRCVHCDHKEQCVAYGAALAGKRTAVAADDGDIEAVAREREEVACIAKAAYARKEHLEQVIKARLEDHEHLDLAGMRYEVVPTCRVEYALEPTLEALEEATWMPREKLVAQVATVDRDALRALLDEVGKALPRSRMLLLRAELDARADRTITPRLSARRSRP